MADHNDLGNKGEDKAVAFLKSKGYRIIERNWTFHGYEIDIIAEDCEFIIFTEVKTRATDVWGNPEDAVRRQRMRRMINSASHYLKINCIDKPARFDIIAIVWNEGKPVLEHFEDAFMAFL
jgi:putative endonuclease